MSSSSSKKSLKILSNISLKQNKKKPYYKDIDKEKKPCIKGTGEDVNSFGEVSVLGAQDRFGNTHNPTYLQQGNARRIQSADAGAEILNWSPKLHVYNLYTNASRAPIIPEQSISPMNENTITVTLPQKPGTFLDVRSSFIVKMTTQMYLNDAPWTATAPAVAYQKRISPINNVGPSLFRNIHFRLNNQELTVGRTIYSEMDYFSTLFQTPLTKYQNGDLTKKGFWKETAGHLDQWNCDDGTAANPPTNALNPARAKLCQMYYQGKEVELEFQIKCPITENIIQAPFNQVTNMTLTFERHPNTYYLLSGPNDAAAQPADLSTIAKQCSIRIKKFQIFQTSLELNSTAMAQYQAGFTNEHPDEYVFVNHAVQMFTPTVGAQQFDKQMSYDRVPDRIALALVDKQARLGHIERNPYRFFKLPALTKFQWLVNSSSMYRYYLETNSEAYDRFRTAICNDLKDPLISRDDYLLNDNAVAPQDSGYTLYCDNLTFTSRRKDGSISEDQRAGAVTMFVELPVGTNLPNNLEFMIHSWDTRSFSISTEGQVAKNFI